MLIKIILLKCECQILHMGLSTADSKQVLCRVILFKVLSLGLMQSLWLYYTTGSLNFHHTNDNIICCSFKMLQLLVSGRW